MTILERFAATFSCTSDGERFDPYLLDDPVSQCKDSAQIGAINAPLHQALVQLDKDHGNGVGQLDIVFTNKGDKPLNWSLALESNPEMLEWTVPKTRGFLPPCESETLAFFFNPSTKEARVDPYHLHFILNSNSLRDSRVAITVNAFVTAVPFSSIVSAVQDDIAQVAAGDKVSFTITPMDAAGVAILDSANLAYTATLTHRASNQSVLCRVVYECGEMQCYLTVQCEIPQCISGRDAEDGAVDTNCVPPIGEFDLEVIQADALQTLIGGTHYMFVVGSCPADYYYYEGPTHHCKKCPQNVVCAANSLISDWHLLRGYWRADDESDDVRECRFGARSCPGANLSQATGEDAYCGPEFSGPLCSQCATDHFLSWAGEGDCLICESDKSHWPTIGLGSSLLILAALFLGVFRKFCKVKSEALPSTFATLERLYLLAKVKIFTLFLVAQVICARHAPRHLHASYCVTEALRSPTRDRAATAIDRSIDRYDVRARHLGASFACVKLSIRRIKSTKNKRESCVLSHFIVSPNVFLPFHSPGYFTVRHDLSEYGRWLVAGACLYFCAIALHG